MKSSAATGSICEGVGYHKYMLLLVKTDVEWTRQHLRRGKDIAWAFQGNQGVFAQACYQYAQGIEDYCVDFCKANSRFPAWKPLRDTRPADWLYHPAFYVPFGHADTMALCLLDDFEPVTYLSGEIPTTTEDLCLAFCPDLTSLGLKPGLPLQDPHKIFRGTPRPAPLPKDKWKEFCPPPFRSQERTPLVAFTYFRLDGLANLGQALLFQYALFRAMGRRIQHVNRWLLDRFDTDATVSALLEHKRSINSARCCLLDLQSAEEVGTLCLCDNFTMALSYVHALRSLTYSDVFAADLSGELRKAFEQSQVCEELMRRAAKGAKGLRIPSDDHVFRWSHTSLGVSTSTVFNEEGRRPCYGYAEAYVQLHIPPGHQDCVEKRFRTVPQKKSRRYAGPSNYRRVEVGPGDLLRSYEYDRKYGVSSLCHISGIVELMGTNLRTFGVDMSRGRGRDITDTVTQLVIPIPRLQETEGGCDLLAGGVGPGHVTALTKALPQVQKSLCFGLHGDGGIKRGDKRHLGRLSTDDLKTQMKLRGVPLALRRVIESLFLDLATVIADPFLFDSVLDLYDAFAAFHTVLTEHLGPHSRYEEISLSPPYALAPDTIRQLSLFATALHNALEHRLAKAYPHGQVRDMGADFRGGLNQLVLAADAPLKCGLGLVRRFVIGRGGKKTAAPPDRYDLVGGVAHISFRPGARFQSMHFQSPEPGGEWSHLALFEVDVPHILHVPSHVGYLHEAYHMVVDTLIRKDASDPVAQKLRSMEETRDDVVSERANEVFALIMCHLFVFGNDRRNFVRTNLTLFGQSETAAGVGRNESVLQVGEFLLRLFMAYDAFDDGEIRNLSQRKQDWSGRSVKQADVLERFEPFWAVAAPVLWHSQALDPSVLEFQRGYCLRLLKAAYPELTLLMPWLWAHATDVYRKYVAEACGGRDPYEPGLEREIHRAVRRGIPLATRIRGLSSRHRKGSFQARQGSELDSLLLICRMLQYYYRTTLKIDGKLFHLRRSGPGLRVNYADPPVLHPWHVFQIDRAVSSMFCPVPEARSERLRRQIALMKSFWNISAVLRNRRLGAILKDNLK